MGWHVCHSETEFFRSQMTGLLSSFSFPRLSGASLLKISSFSPVLVGAVSETVSIFALRWRVITNVSSLSAQTWLDVRNLVAIPAHTRGGCLSALSAHIGRGFSNSPLFFHAHVRRAWLFKLFLSPYFARGYKKLFYFPPTWGVFFYFFFLPLSLFLSAPAHVGCMI